MNVLSLDPALGGGNSLIATQFTDQKLYVLDCRIDYGLSRTEQQIEAVAGFARKYRPTTLIVEYDAQQKGLGNDDRLRDLGAVLGFQIRPHLTRGQKIDETFGVASMNQSFVRREISIPWADDEAKRRMDALVAQLRAWRPDIPTKRLRQDAVMSLWFAWRYWMQIRKAHAPVVALRRQPSWVVGGRVA